MIPWFLTLPFFQLVDFGIKPTFHAVRFEKGTRYYTIHLHKDLFDDWVLVVINGRIQTNLGKIRTLAFPSFTDAFNQFCTAIKLRAKRGYSLESYKTYNPIIANMPAYKISYKTD